MCAYAILAVSHHSRAEATLFPRGLPASVCRPAAPGRPATPWRPHELVLDDGPEDHRVAGPREPEPGAEPVLEAASEPPVEHGKYVVLLLLRRIDVADLPDRAEELERGLEVRRQAIVDAGGVVELQRAPFLAHGRQLEDRVHIEREASEVARHDRPELELEARLRAVRHLGFEVPPEVDGVAPLVPQRAAATEAYPGILGLLAGRPLEVQVPRHVDLVGQPVVVLEARAEEM